MALRIRRGLESQRTSIVPEQGELLYVTDHAATGASPLWIGDGSTAGGNSVSGVAPGVANTLARYTGTSSNLVPSASLTWDDTSNLLQVSAGTITVTAGNGPRSLLNLHSYFNSSRSNSLTLSRSRGNEATPLPLVGDDYVGTINFSSYDGVSTAVRSSISGKITLTGVTSQGPLIAATFNSKTGTGPYYVTFDIPYQSPAPTAFKQYTVSGNGNSLYNGSYTASATTNTTITLAYTVDPGTFGAGLTSLRLAPITPTGLFITGTTSNGNTIKSIKLYPNGGVTIGPNVDDNFANAGGIVDPAWNGTLSVISTLTGTTNIAQLASVTLKGYFDGATGQYLAMQRYRGTVTTPTAVQPNDQIYNLNFSAYDGVGTVRSSNIRALVDGTVSTGIVPGALLFTTTSATGVQAAALRLNSSQAAIFGGEIQVGGTISSTITPATYWNYDASGSTLTLTLGQAVQFANFSGSILVNCHVSGTVTQYLCGGGGDPIALGSSALTNTGTMAYNAGISGYTFVSTEAGIHSFYVVRTRNAA